MKITVDMASRGIKGLTNWRLTKEKNVFFADITPTKFLQTCRQIFPDAFLKPEKSSSKDIIKVGVGKDEFDMDILLVFNKKEKKIYLYEYVEF